MVLVVLLKQILLVQVSVQLVNSAALLLELIKWLKPVLGPGAGRAGWGLAGLGPGQVEQACITGVIMTLVIARVVSFKGSISNTSFIGSSRVGNGFDKDMVQEPIALDDKDQSGLKVSQELVNTQLFLSTTPIAVCTAQSTALMASLTSI
ncbi:hypothetical protein BY996DRAFT_6413355 [Phakopsora pachyrhizi]|nr:hypothetical protein BY996DRAFT_6413355 [Phakopsora pachyrhizi]